MMVVDNYSEERNQNGMREPLLSYQAPPAVAFSRQGNEYLLSTAEGGKIWVDRKVVQLWEAAKEHSITDILAKFQTAQKNEAQIRAGLACLAEAGLLRRNTRQGAPATKEIRKCEPVSIIIVSYNSIRWLEGCFRSISEQTYPSWGITLVDNASEDGSADWVEEHARNTKLIRLSKTGSFAQALNLGIKASPGSYYLLLNPDVRLERNAIAELVHKAQQASSDGSPCAAVASKLCLSWAPGFLNGLGNLVGALAWGTDIGLGHLDLGQFDDWSEAPSACFAAALIPAQSFEEIGAVDEGFPMYYEDSEWCYRARLMGYQILTAPRAVVFHAFNFQDTAHDVIGPFPTKLRRVAYGRLRFIARINGDAYFRRFQVNYFLEDLVRGVVYLLSGRIELSRALINGWKDFKHDQKSIMRERKEIQANRRLSDYALYDIQRKLPAPKIYKGWPILTWDIICNEYLPMMTAGKTRTFPETSCLLRRSNQGKQKQRPGFFSQSFEIAKNEGMTKLVSRLGRKIQWRLMQP